MSFKITDELFQKAINEVSADGAHYFAPEHLLYALDRRLSKWKWGSWIGGFVAIAIPILLAGAGEVSASVLFGLIFAVGIAILLVALMVRAHRMRPDRPLRFDHYDFRGLLSTWQSAHGKLTRLLEDGAYETNNGPTLDAALRTELTKYSFERAVVTDKMQPAALLVANKFHLDNDCPVLSLDGYPTGSRDTILEMLRGNPKLKVMAVHDASATGCGLPIVLRNEPWFCGIDVKVIDLGLRPKQARSMRIPALSQGSRVVGAAKELLSRREIEWLGTGKTMELAALPPAKLMRAINRGFARFDEMLEAKAPATSTSDNGIWFFGAGDGDSGDAAESFG